MEWMNWTNFAYAMVLVFTIMGTMVAQKYRIVVKELKDVAQTYKEASKDGKISEKEKEQLKLKLEFKKKFFILSILLT